MNLVPDLFDFAGVLRGAGQEQSEEIGQGYPFLRRNHLPGVEFPNDRRRLRLAVCEVRFDASILFARLRGRGVVMADYRGVLWRLPPVLLGFAVEDPKQVVSNVSAARPRDSAGW